MAKRFDFSGYATRNDLKCSDGRTIRKDAFKENDGTQVPLVWQHIHNDPSNVLGHAVLENRADGTYCYCSFNDTMRAQEAKKAVEHGDISALSIYANQLKQKGGDVLHGLIREVSLVMTGANPGAYIENLEVQHGDSYETDETSAIIFANEGISTEDLEHEDKPSGDKTVQEVFDTLNDEQLAVVYYMLGEVVKDAGKGDPKDAPPEGDTKIEHSDEGGNKMKKNVFDKQSEEDVQKTTLSHAQLKEIMEDAQKCGSFKESFLAHAVTYGIENIDFLFPDAKTVTPTPDFISREMSWVQGVIGGTHHSPFSRIKSTAADITAEEARAKGYVTGALKKEEVIKLLKRVTNPTTVYKKQKLDRDDIIDITDLNVVAWLKSEMRIMLDEEIARAVLIGDGRAIDHADKINEENIRPIWKDEDLYAHHVFLPATKTTADIVDDIVRARANYKGSGNPTFYTTTALLTEMLLLKDDNKRRLYATKAELAAALLVADIVDVEPMAGQNRSITVDVTTTVYDLLGILVNLQDYNMGADKGGEVSMFDDFDIDYNQYKYLIEGRCSGALTRPKSALVFEKARAAG